ncbi:MAG: GtrA family protein [Lachnospiraceae bacterium]|nr:GtrA family protein [Lachnospiraceae bacterium]
MAEKLWILIEKICHACLAWSWKLGKKDLPDSTFQAFMQFVKFGIVGFSNTVLAYVLNIGTILLLTPLNVAWDYVAGNLVGFFLSVLWAFFWNNKFVFVAKDGEKRSGGKALLKTYISYGFTEVILNNVLSYIWIDILGISKFIAPAFNLVLSVPINFFINKLWAFKTEKAE